MCNGRRTTLAKSRAKPKEKDSIYKPGLEVEGGEYSERAALALRHFRREMSRDLEVPPFIVFDDKTLRALATALPCTREDFLAVKGTGPTSWERFGPKVLEICLGAKGASD